MLTVRIKELEAVKYLLAQERTDNRFDVRERIKLAMRDIDRAIGELKNAAEAIAERQPESPQQRRTRL